MADVPILTGAVSQPRDHEGPVFDEPWGARAFAIVVKLYENGHYTWPEWVEYLAAEVAAAKKLDDPTAGPKYYEQWLAASEKLVADKGLATRRELADRKVELDVPSHH